jgi:hypothetical protein
MTDHELIAVVRTTTKATVAKLGPSRAYVVYVDDTIDALPFEVNETNFDLVDVAIMDVLAEADI